jgi:hypothetical protein
MTTVVTISELKRDVESFLAFKHAMGIHTGAAHSSLPASSALSLGIGVKGKAFRSRMPSPCGAGAFQTAKQSRSPMSSA